MTSEHPLILEVAMEMGLPRPLLNDISERFGPEKARECAMGTSVGGIGPLIRERIFGQSEQGLPVVGVSLLYDQVWTQNWKDGYIELSPHSFGDALRAVLTKTDLDFSMELYDGTTVPVTVWKHAYDGATVYFLDSPSITQSVYPGDQDAPAGTKNPGAWSHFHRLKQFWMVGRGALRLMKKINQKPGIVVLSETPTFFAHHWLIKDDLQHDPFFNETKYVFNDHTPMEYAHPLWDQNTLKKLKLDSKVYSNTPAWNRQKHLLDVTALLVNECQGVFGVAQKHGHVMRQMPSLKRFDKKIKSITNGIRKEDWQSPAFHGFEQKTNEELIQIKDQEKQALINWLARREGRDAGWIERAQSLNILVWTRRITGYKRLDVLVQILRDLELREKFLNTNSFLIIGGRVHQSDPHGQKIVHDLLSLVNAVPEVKERVQFLENFNLWEAPRLYQGADGSIMISDDTREASATGFMKAQVNGGVIVCSADGATPEFVRFVPNEHHNGNFNSADYKYHGGNPNLEFNGVEVPYKGNEPTALALIQALKKFNELMNNPEKRGGLLRAALAVTPKVDISRTVRETKNLYADVLLSSHPEPGRK